MHTRRMIVASAMGIILAGLWGGIAPAQDLPVAKGKRIVASVNGGPITMDEFTLEIASIRRDLAPGEQVDKKTEKDVLERMINTRLIVQEARQVGLDKLPEVAKLVD